MSEMENKETRPPESEEPVVEEVKAEEPAVEEAKAEEPAVAAAAAPAAKKPPIAVLGAAAAVVLALILFFVFRVTHEVTATENYDCSIDRALRRGQVIETVFKDAKGQAAESVETDAQGQPVRARVVNADGSATVYHVDGTRITAVEQYDGQDVRVSEVVHGDKERIERSFFGDGTIRLEEVYDGKDALLTRREGESDGSYVISRFAGKDVVETEAYGADGSCLTTLLNDAGDPETETLRDSGGKVLQETVYSYDEDGDLVLSEESSFTADGQLSRLRTVESYIPCSKVFDRKAMGHWLYPVSGPEEPVTDCLSMNLRYLAALAGADAMIGEHTVYVRLNDRWEKYGSFNLSSYLDTGLLELRFDTPSKVESFMVVPENRVDGGRMGFFWLEDVVCEHTY